MTTSSYIYSFPNNKDDNEKKINIGPLVFGAVSLVSTFYFGSPANQINLPFKFSINSIQSYNLTKSQEEPENYSLQKNSIDENESSTTLHFNNDGIIKLEIADELGDLDMEELRRIQDKLDKFADTNHELQIKMTENIATLSSEMKSVKEELSRLNKTQESLPKTIRDEIAKIKIEKSNTLKNVWLAPLITGLVIGLVLLFGEFFLGLL